VALERVAAQDLERLVADELALAIVVRGDHDLVGSLGDRAQRGQRASRTPVDHPREVRLLDHVPEVLEAPAPVGVGEHRLHHVPAQADGDALGAVLSEVIGADLEPAAAVFLDGHLAAEDLGDLTGG
jgi:hypothetical protein